MSRPDQTLIVDIGGGVGHDLAAFRSQFPILAGKLIVHDSPVVVESIQSLPNGLEAMKYDFFAPQPIKGAKAYYLRTVLYDWPDKQALEILQHIKFAMTEDSILLINENVLSETQAYLYPAKLDLSMMALFSSLERTRSQFQSLLEQAGFHILGCGHPKKV